MDGLTLLFLFLGFTALVVGAEWLVRGASGLALAMGMSPLLIGLTVVAFGTSAPELAVSVQAAIEDRAGLALGNIVGSNICNVLLILGAAAIVMPLHVEHRLVRRDVPIMIGVSVLLYVLALDGQLSRENGLVLFALVIAYTVYSIIEHRREGSRTETGEPDSAQSGSMMTHLLWLAVGIGLLVLGAQWLVDSAVKIAQHFGLSELLIGLTVIALGTSLPELATSVVAALRGQGDIAVGNVVGSCLLNILLVLGLTSAISPSALPVTEGMIAVDLPIMLVTAVACLPIFFTGFRIDRWEGALFLAFYALYMAYLALNATDHERLSWFSSLGLFVVPLTLLTLFVLAWRYQRRRKRSAR